MRRPCHRRLSQREGPLSGSLWVLLGTDMGAGGVSPTKSGGRNIPAWISPEKRVPYRQNSRRLMQRDASEASTP
jgi:hypothetical protein